MPPVIAVTGVRFEARIAAGPDVTVLCGSDPLYLRASLKAALTRGASGVISFGTAGGLAPDLATGDFIVASAIVKDQARLFTDPIWSEHLLRSIRARPGEIASVDAPVAHEADKRRLRGRTGASAVDMESFIAAGVALEHAVPFVACRVILDPAGRTLPDAALAGFRRDGTLNIAGVIGALLRRPGELPDLIRVGREARAARAALVLARRQLGPRFGLPTQAEVS
jgi:hopanoid-associated phosphorylase